MTAQLVTDALDDGDLATRQAGRAAAPLRSRQPIHQRAVPAADGRHGVTCSMSRSGNVWDNAAMESFFSSLKTERTARKTYRTRDQAKADVFDYIERFYNPRRRHSTLGYLSPMEFEKQARVSLGSCPLNRQQLMRFSSSSAFSLRASGNLSIPQNRDRHL